MSRAKQALPCSNTSVPTATENKAINFSGSVSGLAIVAESSEQTEVLL